MKSVAVSSLDFPAAGLEYAHEEGQPDAYITIPAPSVPEGVPAPRAARVAVRTDGTNLKFFPERSSTHKRVLTMLGVAF